MNTKITLYPILSDLRNLYSFEDQMERFWAYINLMTKDKGERLPLGDFSPMGKRQSEFLDALIGLKAESHVENFLEDFTEEISTSKEVRIIFVVVDEPRNGWTQKYLTDAEYRFCDVNKYQNLNSLSDALWVPVYLWTTDFEMNELQPTLEYVLLQTKKAIFRTKYKLKHGRPLTLQDVLNQEKESYIFSQKNQGIVEKNLSLIGPCIDDYLSCSHFSIIFTVFYGDKAAETVGYAPLELEGNSLLKCLTMSRINQK